MTFACVLKQNRPHLRHRRLFEKAFQQRVSYSNIHFFEVFFYARGSLTKKVLLSKVVAHFIFFRGGHWLHKWWLSISVAWELLKQPVLRDLKEKYFLQNLKLDWKPHRLLKINKDFLFKINFHEIPRLKVIWMFFRVSWQLLSNYHRRLQTLHEMLCWQKRRKYRETIKILKPKYVWIMSAVFTPYPSL